ncbi:MAG: pyridoxal phosphate-dependent aminotransferase [Oscillospiraceae bacterium]|nr:pyridoxal phosphate-dependent aminotransferase [Oscillospiraceae bacterium]
MKYNFDEIVDRRGTDCLKYDFGMKRKGRDDLLPMWVADMDFRLPDEILNALHKRIEHGIFGYTDPLDDYFEALNHWYSTRYGFTAEPDWVTLGACLVYGIHVSVTAFTEPGDAVMVMQPVYYPFSEAIRNNGRKLVNCQLHYEDGRYSIDFADMERKIKEEGVKALIFCSPHNPVGRVWTEEELVKVADLCLANNVVLMVDEIHSDFIFPGRRFFSCMCLPEKYRKILAFYSSPGKTFNIAGLQAANIIIPDPELRAKYRKANTAAGYSQGNIMGQCALMACYTLGADWVDELVEYIYGNVQYAKAFIEENIPNAKVVDPEGTYLLWVDFSRCGLTAEELEHLIVDDAKLWLDSGRIFGAETALFERFNLACPRSVVEQAMLQLKQAFDKRG